MVSPSYVRRGALLLLLIGASFSFGEDTPSPVQVKATAEKAVDGKQVVQVAFTVQKPWHIYANPVRNEDMEANITVITLKTKVESYQVQYPKGERLTDKFGNQFNAHEGQVTIPVVVQRLAGDTSPLELSVRYNCCKERICLPTKTVALTVP